MKRTLKTSLSKASFAFLFSLFCLPAIAQSDPQPETTGTIPTDLEETSAEATTMELLPQRIVGRGQDLRGIRVAKPGALLFASFDDDHSLSISFAEIDANAVSAFARADVNQSGTLSIFEQQDWAAAVGSYDGPLANTMTFDSNIDRQVTQEEFTAGLKRLAKSYMRTDETEIQFASLLFKPNGKDADKRDNEDAPQRLSSPKS